MEHKDLEKILSRGAREIGIELNESQIDQFIQYFSNLQRWNEVTNLTGITDPVEIVVKHFVDSLIGLTAYEFSTGALICDVGSGAGFPGIPLKVARPDTRIQLVEPNKKKGSFLQGVIGTLRLKEASVFLGTFDQFSRQSQQQAIDIITLRALRFEEISAVTTRVLRPHGKIVLFRAESLSKSDLPHDFVLESEKHYSLPLGYGNRVVSVVALRESTNVPRGT